MVDIKKTTVRAVHTHTMEFPVLESFADYHYIDDHADRLAKMLKRKIGRAEIGFCENGQYWGIFYVGRKPSKAVIKQMMDDENFKPMYPEDE